MQSQAVVRRKLPRLLTANVTTACINASLRFPLKSWNATLRTNVVRRGKREKTTYSDLGKCGLVAPCERVRTRFLSRLHPTKLCFRCSKTEALRVPSLLRGYTRNGVWSAITGDLDCLAVIASQLESNLSVSFPVLFTSGQNLIPSSRLVFALSEAAFGTCLPCQTIKSTSTLFHLSLEASCPPAPPRRPFWDP